MNQRATSAGGPKDDAVIPDLGQPATVLIIVLITELLAVVLSVARDGIYPVAWREFALTSLLMQWISLVSALGLSLARQRLNRLSAARAAGVSYAWVLLVTVALSLIGQWLGAGAPLAPWQPEGRVLAAHALIGSVLAGIALRYLYLSQALHRRERAALAARVEALQARIRPHFLFNTMNSIASLIGSNPVAAEAAVEDLAALFRASLAAPDGAGTWADEQDLCRRYLRIEAGRLGERLQVDWQVAGVPDDLPMPRLTLQPLLENAIYHGIQRLPQGGVVTVRGHVAQGSVEWSVSNPLPPAPAVQQGGNRLAVANIGHRLQALYGEDAGVSLRREQGSFVARLWYDL